MRSIDRRFKQEVLEGTSEEAKLHVFVFVFSN
jgi:hypothetical protein